MKLRKQTPRKRAKRAVKRTRSAAQDHSRLSLGGLLGLVGLVGGVAAMLVRRKRGNDLAQTPFHPYQQATPNPVAADAERFERESEAAQQN